MCNFHGKCVHAQAVRHLLYELTSSISLSENLNDIKFTVLRLVVAAVFTCYCSIRILLVLSLAIRNGFFRKFGAHVEANKSDNKYKQHHQQQ